MIELKSIIFEYSVRNKGREDFPVYSVTNSQGFCKDYFGKEVASTDKSSYKIVPYGYFAYNPSRINVGSIDWQHCEDNVIVSPLYNIFGVDTSKVRQDYLLYCLKSRTIMQYINTLAKGTVRMNLPLKTLSSFHIPLPPLSEQERIVSELDLLTEVIDKQKAQLKELDTLAQSIFYDMFGDPVLNDKGWEKKKLGEVGTIQRGKGIQKNDFVANGKPCIHYGQLHTSFGISTNKHISEISESLFNQSIIAKKGDLLFALTSEDVEGSCKATAWMGSYDVALSSDAALFRHCLNPIFVSYYFLSEGFYIQKQKYARGFKVTHIKTSDIINFEIPLPPLSLQQSFADKVSAIEQQKAAIGRSIAETQQLFDYTMDKYFG